MIIEYRDIYKEIELIRWIRQPENKSNEIK